MRRSTCLLLASGMLVACSTQPTDPAASPSDTAPAAPGVIASAAQSLASSGPRDGSVEDVHTEPADPAGSRGRPQTSATAETTAADAVLQLVEDEGLLVLDLDSSLKVEGDGPTVVLVRVLFGTGRSHPREETYRVRLAGHTGGWAVVDLEVES